MDCFGIRKRFSNQNKSNTFARCDGVMDLKKYLLSAKNNENQMPETNSSRLVSAPKQTSPPPEPHAPYFVIGEPKQLNEETASSSRMVSAPKKTSPPPEPHAPHFVIGEPENPNEKTTSSSHMVSAPKKTSPPPEPHAPHFVIGDSEVQDAQEGRQENVENAMHVATSTSPPAEKRHLFFIPDDEPENEELKHEQHEDEPTTPRVGFGQNLKLLPGCTHVPRKSAKQQESALVHPETLPIYGVGNGRLYIPDSTNSLHLYLNGDRQPIRVPSNTPPPPDAKPIDEFGEEALIVHLQERGHEIMARMETPIPGLLTDAEILEGLITHRDAMSKPSSPGPTPPPSEM